MTTIEDKRNIFKVKIKKDTVKNMTNGNISVLLLQFSVPLIFGNLFQMMYNTVDSLVVGNFVGKEALAAVGATTNIVNILVFFFNGLSIGATVIIGRYFGSGNQKKLHDAVETTMFMALFMGALLTVVGICMVGPMLSFMSTPDDVIDEATTYLNIYFAGFAGLLIYNMSSGILRAVGDTLRPLLLLILTSIVNVFLDLLFVISFDAKIAGVAYATIISQAISAILVLVILTRTKDVIRLKWHDIKCDFLILREIFVIGLPAAAQSCITQFSNAFVQSYINYFGSTVMAGWSSYNKLDTFIMLPVQSFAQAATTFTSQNMGAEKITRVKQGVVQVLKLGLGVTAIIVILLFIFAPQAINIFSSDEGVVDSGILFIRTNVFFLLFNCVAHILAGCLRGMGDSTGSMLVMLANWVILRQTYLYIMTRFILNNPQVVGFGYPFGWISCSICMMIYYLRHIKKMWQNTPNDIKIPDDIKY